MPLTVVEASTNPLIIIDVTSSILESPTYVAPFRQQHFAHDDSTLDVVLQ